MIYVIENEEIKVSVDSHGAELVSAVGKDGYEYVWQGDAEYWDGHSPVLFPHCGKILDGKYTTGGVEYRMNAHGLARDFEFSPTRVTKTELVLTLTANEETKKIYPFDFALTARFAVEDNALVAEFTVENKGDKVMPYMFGWHPAFTLDNAGGSAIGEYKLSMNAGESVSWYPLQHGCFVRPYGEDYATPSGEYYLNEKEIYDNDTMIFVGVGERAVLSCEKENHDVDFTWSKNLPYFCIWKAPHSEARFVCLEPWSDVPGDGETAENFDVKRMSRLAPGAEEVYSYDVKFC